MVVPEKMENAVVSEEMEKKVEINLGEVGKTVEMNNEDAEISVNGEKMRTHSTIKMTPNVLQKRQTHIKIVTMCPYNIQK